jgi:integrase
MSSPEKRQSRATRLTDKIVQHFPKAPEGTRTETKDSLTPGLTLRVTDKGTKTWTVRYRRAGGADGKRGKSQQMTLGVYPILSLADARKLAAEKITIADTGADPAAQHEEEVQNRNQRTFDVILERFISVYCQPDIKSGPATKRMLREHALPKLKGRSMEKITRAEVHELLDTLSAKHTPSIAREVRKHLSKLFNWAVDRGALPASPLAGMRRPDLAQVARERVLTPDELKKVWDAAGTIGYPFGTMTRLLILTAQRRNEIAGLRRSWLRPEQDAVEIPASEYKTDRPHVFPLSTPAKAIVEKLPLWNRGDFMISTTAGERPVSGFSKAKTILNDMVGFSDWTYHDLRRTAATRMAEMGVIQEHIERVLGHAIEGVAGTYNRYSYLKEKQAALELWGRQWVI